MGLLAAFDEVDNKHKSNTDVVAHKNSAELFDISYLPETRVFIDLGKEQAPLEFIGMDNSATMNNLNQINGLIAFVN